MPVAFAEAQTVADLLNDLGVALGADGMMRLRARLVRIPDVSFISWEQIPSGEFPSNPIPDLYPDLAVERIVCEHSPTWKLIAGRSPV